MPSLDDIRPVEYNPAEAFSLVAWVNREPTQLNEPIERNPEPTFTIKPRYPKNNTSGTEYYIPEPDVLKLFAELAEQDQSYYNPVSLKGPPLETYVNNPYEHRQQIRNMLDRGDVNGAAFNLRRLIQLADQKVELPYDGSTAIERLEQALMLPYYRRIAVSYPSHPYRFLEKDIEL